MNRRSMTHIPVWVRVPAIIALVLVGVLVGSILVGAWDDGHSSGGSHGSGGRMETRDHTGGRSGETTITRDHGGAPGHGSGSGTVTRDHGG
jgi:hypothetical protein